MNTGLNNRNVFLNTVGVFSSFILGLFISFFISPYIVKALGAEALGFLKLSGDIATYATLATTALNSMAARYLMLARERGEIEKMKSYVTTLIFSNIFIVIILAILLSLVIIHLDKLLDVPEHLLTQVRIAYSISFFSFCLSLAFSTYGACFYLMDKLYVSTFRNFITRIISPIIICVLLYCFGANITYMTIGGLLGALYTCYTNFYFFRKWLPELKLQRAYFSFKRLKELLVSGIWNSITKLSQIFSNGLDLLISNIYLNAVAMGHLSIAKMIPAIMIALNTNLAASFSPNLMQHYAAGNITEMKKAAKTAIKFMCLFVTLPTAGLIVYGEEFFRLWMPNQPAELINILSILTLINSCITGPMLPLYQIFTITNKVKTSSIVIIIYGFISILVTLICLETTDLGLYAVAGVSMIGSFIVSLGYHLPYSAKYIGLPWYEFFPEIGQSVLSLIAAVMVGFGIKYVMPSTVTWLLWFSEVILMCLIGFFLNLFITLKSGERRVLFNIIFKKITT